jgi:sulfite oxidase
MSKLDYRNDPKQREGILTVRKDAPFNAEPIPTDLIKNYITPEKYFFCRNHGPLPDLKEDEHTIHFQGLGTFEDKTYTISVQDLKTNFKKESVMMVMQVS